MNENMPKGHFDADLDICIQQSFECMGISRVVHKNMDVNAVPR